MAAAGVPQSGKVCTCRHEISYHVYDGGALGGHGTLGPCAACECDKRIGLSVYPDPLTPEGFVALWDALEARGWRVEFRTLCDGTLSQVYKADEMGRPDLASIFQGGHESRAAALLEAAAQALGVKP